MCARRDASARRPAPSAGSPRRPDACTGSRLFGHLPFALLVLAGLVLLTLAQPAAAHDRTPPSGVTVTVQSTSSLRVTWSTVWTISQPFGYQVQWRVKQPQGSWQGGTGAYIAGDLSTSCGKETVPDRRPNCAHTITNLQSGTTYEVRVGVHFSDHNHWSTLAEGTTPSNDATLGGMFIVQSADSAFATSNNIVPQLNPDFDKATENYTTTTLPGHRWVRVQTFASDTTGATVKVGKAGDLRTLPGTYLSHIIELTAIETDILIVVTAEDGVTTKTYTVTVTATPVVSYSQAEYELREAADGQGGDTVTVTVNINPPLAQASTVRVLRLSQGATADLTDDYTVASGLNADWDLALSAGASSASFTLQGVADETTEGPETIRLGFRSVSSPPYGFFRGSRAIVNIVDNSVTSAQSTDATLSGLTVTSSDSRSGTFSALTLTPAFAAATTTYSADAGYDPFVKLTPTVNDASASVTVRKQGNPLTAVSSGTASGVIVLGEGANNIYVEVTAEDGTTTKTYTVTVTRAESGPAEPTNFQVAAGDGKLTLSWEAPSHWGRWPAAYYAVLWKKGNLPWQDRLPKVDATATSYVFTGTIPVWVNGVRSTETVTNGVTYSLRLYAWNANPDDSSKGFSSVGVEASGTPAAAPPQSNDATLSGLTATSSDSATGTFTSLTLTPNFAASTTSYTANVANGVTHVKLTPTVNHSAASVEVGKQGQTLTAVSSGTPSGAIALAEGVNPITVKVTAEDGTTIETYTVTVTRAATTGSCDGVWCTTFDVTKLYGGGIPGCQDSSDACSTALSATTFTYGGTTYTIDGLLFDAVVKEADIQLDKAWPTGLDNAKLQVGSRELPHKDYFNRRRNRAFTMDPPITLPASGTVDMKLVLGSTPTTRTVTLSATPESVAEGSDVTVRATLSVAATAETVIPLSYTDDSADSGDYDALASITIASGATYGEGTIATNQDADTDDETFTVSLGTLPSGLTGGNTTSVTVTITDDDAPTTPATPTVSLSASPNPVAEGAPVTVRAMLSEALAGDVTIPIVLTQGTAETDDYGTLASITIPAGQTSGEGTVTTSQDADTEDETFTVELGNLPPSVTAGGTTSAVVTITDDDEPPPTKEPTRVTVRATSTRPAEGSTVTLTAELDEPAPADGVKVGFSAFGGTAFAGVDYTLSPESDCCASATREIEIAAGGRRATATLTVIEDGEGEEAESIEIEVVANTAAYTLDVATITLTIPANGPQLRAADARATEGADAVIEFAVTLSRASSVPVTVDYETVDGTATAGADYVAAGGMLYFPPGETVHTVSVTLLDDAHDEGEETFTLRLSNASGARLADAEATGTIKNSDLMPGALLARFGRATAEQVVTHIEERMAAPRQRGFRARFAGRDLQPGQERDFALGFLTQFAQPMGMGGAGAAPMAMGSHAAGAGMGGMGTTGTAGAAAPGMGGSIGMSGPGAVAGGMGMTGQHAQMGGGAAMAGYGPGGAAPGGGLLGAMGMGGDLFSNSEFELNRESRGGILSVWSRSSRSYFSGLEDALSLNGDVRTTMFGADYARGALTLGLSVGRTLGMGGYSGPSGGQMTTSMTGFYPWVGYQVNDRVSVWGTTGYGTGALSLTPDGQSALETGVSMMMSAVGTRGELVGSRATGGFSLAFKADALWVGAASELLDGPAGRLNASEAGVTRVRTALEGSRGYTLAGGRLSLTPSVEVGLRRDGGDAETGAGMDVGGGLAFSDTVTGLSLDVRVRTLVVHQAEGFTDRGMSLSLGWDPSPSSPLGLTATVAPSWGGQAQGGAETLWNNQMVYGMGSHQMYGAGGQLNAEVGYGLPVGARLVGTPRVGLTTSEYGRDYRVGYGLGVLEQGRVNFELGVDAQRRESPMLGEASNGVMGRATVGW